jgi:DNA-binding XRE family transcriptional regulator
MEKPSRIEEIQLVAVLRTLKLSQDEVASAIHVAKASVVAIEKWLREAPLEDVEAVFDTQALQRLISRELPSCEEASRELLVKAPRVTADDILRHYREGYRRKRHASRTGHVSATTQAGQVKSASPGDPSARHREQLGLAADALLSNADKWSRYPEVRGGVNIVDGGMLDHRLWAMGEEFSKPVRERAHELEKADSFLAECLLEHYRYEFPETLRDWRELTPETIERDIHSNLRLLAHSRDFRVCPSCPVCQRSAK